MYNYMCVCILCMYTYAMKAVAVYIQKLYVVRHIQQCVCVHIWLIVHKSRKIKTRSNTVYTYNKLATRRKEEERERRHHLPFSFTRQVVVNYSPSLI